MAFDHGLTFRNEAFPEYKAQREQTPEDIQRSVPIIKDILSAYRIPILQVDGYEADDVIGTMAKRMGAQGVETYMLTPDKDYGQLVGEHVYIFRPRHGGGYETMGLAEVKAKFGVETSEQVIDMLALMGDTADNYPGCPGVGEVTARKLINQFGSIEELLTHTDQLKGKLRERIETHVEDIKMSKYLATICTEVPMETELDDLRIVEPDYEKLSAILQELEFKSFADKILNKSEKAQKEESTARYIRGISGRE